MKKRLNVVMLATQEAESVPFLKNINGRGNNLYPATKGYYYTQQYLKKEQFEAEHLYFTSDEKCKNGDYFIDLLNTVRQFNDKTEQSINDKKIVITTDTSLYRLEDCPVRGGCSNVKYLLPQPTKEFIDLYISEYNKGNIVTEVEVEYNNINDCYGECGICDSSCKPIYKLLTNSDNTVNISLIKDSFSREEVVEKLKNAYHYVRLNPTLNTTKFNKWIEENL